MLAEIPEPKRGAFYLMAEELVRPSEVRAVNLADYQEGIVTIAHAMTGFETSAERKETKEADARRRRVSARLAA